MYYGGGARCWISSSEIPQSIICHILQCVMEVAPDVGLVVVEIAEDETVDSIRSATAAPFEVRLY